MKNTLVYLMATFALYSDLCGEKTLAIIKPDAVAAHHIGAIVCKYEQSGLNIVEMKLTSMTKEDAEQFYAVHKERPFYADLVAFMSSGPVVAMVLEGDDAIKRNRTLIGSTDPKEASPGTIRAEFATSKSKNAVHGSDSVEAAQTEIAFFFKQ